MLHDDEVAPAGEYTYEEFYEMVRKFRARFCSNNLAVYPAMNRLEFIENKHVVYLRDKVILEEI